jgi:SAM-dependent methyltransferase
MPGSSAAAAQRFKIEQVQFLETDLHRPGLRECSSDVVYSSGVLHHTPDPRTAFARVVRLVRPGGMIVLGLYNSFARIPFRLRRLVARLSGYQFIPFYPVLCDRENEPARRTAWLPDQYQHPEEHRHTLSEVQAWFAENGVDYVRTYPSAILSQESVAPQFKDEESKISRQFLHDRPPSVFVPLGQIGL